MVIFLKGENMAENIKTRKVPSAVKAALQGVLLGAVLFVGYQIYQVYYRYAGENKILKAMVNRLEADSRIAEVSGDGCDL
jgi:hypothetical protein